MLTLDTIHNIVEDGIHDKNCCLCVCGRGGEGKQVWIQTFGRQGANTKIISRENF